MTTSPGALAARALNDSPRFRGRCLLPGDGGFDECCAIYNGVFCPRPAAVARCAGVADVVAAIRAAREHGLEIAVRCGGHLAPGFALTDGGLVLDLRTMNQVRVDAATRTARVGGGALSRDLLVETEPFGLAGITGLSGSVGLAGLTLHKGEGYLTPRYGYAADNLLAADLVTADGEVLDVRAGTYPDLLWALRGAAANFGVVTSMQVRLFPMPAEMTSVTVSYAGQANVPRALVRLVEFLDSCSDASFVYGVASISPAGDLDFTVTAGHIGPRGLARSEIGYLTSMAQPYAVDVHPIGYLELIDSNDGFMDSAISGQRHYWDQLESRTAPDVFAGAIAEELERLRRQPGCAGRMFGIATHQHGARRLPDPPTSLTRKTGCPVEIFAGWADPADDAGNIAWVRDTWQRLREAGVASDECHTLTAMSDTSPDRVRKAYGPDGYARLAALKTRYDPSNVFHRNFNIPPGSAAAVPRCDG